MHATARALIRAGLLSMLLLLGPVFARASDLHLVQRFDMSTPSGSLVTQQRDLYLHDRMLALKSQQGWLIVRDDLQTVWVLNPTRQLLQTIPLAQLQQQLAPPGKTPPPFTETRETRTVANLPCRVYRGAVQGLTVEACLTRALPALEGFQGLLGTRPDAPGVPLTLTLTMQAPGQVPLTITHTIERVMTETVDVTLFARPSGPPAGPSAAPRPR